jgi:Domain of unknown function (DUF4126)
MVISERSTTTAKMNIHFAGTELAALIVATSFAAGLNVYATIATMGLLTHAGVLALPGSLHPVASWWVIGACLALFNRRDVCR